MIGAEPPTALMEKSRTGGNGARHVRQSRGGGRLTKRDRDDKALIEAMKVDPAGTIAAWAGVIHKSKGSVATALRRLKDAGLTESSEGHWRLVEKSEPKEPPPRWTKPVHGNDRAAYSHLA